MRYVALPTRGLCIRWSATVSHLQLRSGLLLVCVVTSLNTLSNLVLQTAATTNNSRICGVYEGTVGTEEGSLYDFITFEKRPLVFTRTNGRHDCCTLLVSHYPGVLSDDTRHQLNCKEIVRLREFETSLYHQPGALV